MGWGAGLAVAVIWIVGGVLLYEHQRLELNPGWIGLVVLIGTACMAAAA